MAYLVNLSARAERDFASLYEEIDAEHLDAAAASETQGRHLVPRFRDPHLICLLHGVTNILLMKPSIEKLLHDSAATERLCW
jgi:hypothetical protein